MGQDFVRNRSGEFGRRGSRIARRHPRPGSSMKDWGKTWPGKEEDGPEGIEKWGRTQSPTPKKTQGR